MLIKWPLDGVRTRTDVGKAKDAVLTEKLQGDRQRAVLPGPLKRNGEKTAERGGTRGGGIGKKQRMGDTKPPPGEQTK